jgi:hypothetical protein
MNVPLGHSLSIETFYFATLHDALLSDHADGTIYEVENPGTDDEKRIVVMTQKFPSGDWEIFIN